MRRSAGGVRLAFDPAIEYRIYRTFPHGLAKELPRLRLPAGVICGRESAESRRTGLRRRAGISAWCASRAAPVSFERPEAAAQAIARWRRIAAIPDEPTIIPLVERSKEVPCASC